MTANPARWHPDPTGRHQLRYWNGTAWTEHVSDRGVTSRDPLARRGSPGNLMPSSEGRSTPARPDPLGAHPTSGPRRTQPARPDPLSAHLTSAPRRTQPTRPAPASGWRANRSRPRRSTARRAEPRTPARPTPIVTEAGWSTRTKLLVAFIAVAAIVAAIVIRLVAG
jgi:hypothetical protein